SPDGTFYGRRMSHMRDVNPHYFTRLESDRAVALSMLVNYLPLMTQPEAPLAPFEASVAGGWCEPEHGAVLHRSETRLASFAWRAHGLTQGLCLPPRDPTAISMAEWSLSLAPVVRFLGDEGHDSGKHRRLLHHRIETFDGGFATCGAVMEGVDLRVDEGALCTDQAVTYLAFVALPDGRTCVGLQLVVAADDRLGYLTTLKGLHLNMVNDCFNGFRRTIRTTSGERMFVSPPEEDEVVVLDSPWLSVDEVLEVRVLYGSDGFVVDRSATRRGGRYRSLYVEEVCSSTLSAVTPTAPDEVLIDVGFAVIAGGSAEETAAMTGGRLPVAGDLVRGVWITGADGARYEVVADFEAGQVAVNG
ncbi:MAG: hypothetical protein JXC32_20575, partial [Anaerolineae bacterium]|nr:hypothetical protein [Anaerolineae bacterium]